MWVYVWEGMAPEGVKKVDFLHRKGSCPCTAEAELLPHMENVQLMSGVGKARDKTFSTSTVVCQDHTINLA